MPPEPCDHMDVIAYLHRYPGTRYEPPEIEGYAACTICGDYLDLDDIPEEAKIYEEWN